MNKMEMKKKMLRALASYVWRNDALSLQAITGEENWTDAEFKRWDRVEDELSLEFSRRSGE